jgi:hypothetical protein
MRQAGWSEFPLSMGRKSTQASKRTVMLLLLWWLLWLGGVLRWVLEVLLLMLLRNDEPPDLGLSLLASGEADRHVRRVRLAVNLYHLRWEILAQGRVCVHDLHARRDLCIRNAEQQHILNVKLSDCAPKMSLTFGPWLG